MKGLRSTNWQLQKRHRGKEPHGNIVSNTVMTTRSVRWGLEMSGEPWVKDTTV